MNMLSTDRPVTTKVIIDFSVLCYRITHTLEPLLSLPAFVSADNETMSGLIRTAVYVQMMHTASLDYMGANRPERYHIIYVMDNKQQGKYWRHDYLLRAEVAEQRKVRIAAAHVGVVAPELSMSKGRKAKAPVEPKPMHYKAGRKEHSTLHSIVMREMCQCIKDEPSWDYISVPGYEADDLAATFVHLADGEVPIWLLTIDTDWMGLISPTVAWFCLHGFAPRVRRNMQQVNAWAEKRLDCTLDHPSDIWLYKARHGDSSDNLPIFSPIEVIDLLQPPAEYRLWDSRNRSEFEDILYSPKVSKGNTILSAMYLDKMRKLGIRPVVQAT